MCFNKPTFTQIIECNLIELIFKFDRVRWRRQRWARGPGSHRLSLGARETGAEKLDAEKWERDDGIKRDVKNFPQNYHTYLYTQFGFSILLKNCVFQVQNILAKEHIYYASL